MKYIKRVAVFCSLSLIATLFVFTALPIAVLYGTKFRGGAARALNALAAWWARLIIIMSKATVHAAGLENIPGSGPVCFVSNHSGIFDIVLFLAKVGRPFGFIAKKELAFIPFLNIWIVLLGGLFIERNRPRKALQTIREGARRIAKGGSMIIFPEGTRSKGRGLLPFKPGAFKMALESGALIVPVAITGSYDVFEKTGFIEPADVYISFGRPIEQTAISAEHKRQALSDAAYKAVAEMLAVQKQTE
ncbi:MAG: 1-acyl-sn-glycerol-3-phosphate acyltransferase [Spirochaetaceae bacterium]|jgi:1-acyl-sn-glycerol-3-phosphate acyltransferase|nr:1-acyl-sn-glycerol-3-phosphate acyltransferase [Spirochaetaceae bacterium]